jgi:hypothetical protein
MSETSPWFHGHFESSVRCPSITSASRSHDLTFTIHSPPGEVSQGLTTKPPFFKGRFGGNVNIRRPLEEGFGVDYKYNSQKAVAK